MWVIERGEGGNEKGGSERTIEGGGGRVIKRERKGREKEGI